MKLNKNIMDVLDKHGFSVHSIDKQDGEYVAEIEAYSPLGEDLGIAIFYNGTNADFVYKFEQYSIDFDPDEHAEELIEMRGTHGVPCKIRDLIDDADAIEEMLSSVSMAICDIDPDDYEDEDSEFVRQNWEEVLDSRMEYSEIANAIKWGFTDEDLNELMRLHKENKNREKIEDLLTDCNFHFECSHWHDGDYVIDKED